MGKPNIERDIITLKEVKEAIELALDLRIKAMLTFMYITGARISEVLNMKTGNFYIDGLGLHIKISVLKRGKPFIHSLRVAMRTPLIDYLLEQ